MLVTFILLSHCWAARQGAHDVQRNDAVVHNAYAEQNDCLVVQLVGVVQLECKMELIIVDTFASAYASKEFSNEGKWQRVNYCA